MKNFFWAGLSLVVFNSFLMADSTMNDSFYDYTVDSISSKKIALSDYKGKVSLVVNTASKCGYTPQYADLQEIYEKYSAKGFTVLAFPSNDFGGQEPGTNDEIAQFCSASYKVTFPLFSKVSVSGDKKEDAFSFLISQAPEKGEIEWNFEKFLVDEQGKVIARFRSPIRPNSPEVTSAIEKLISEPKG